MQRVRDRVHAPRAPPRTQPAIITRLEWGWLNRGLIIPTRIHMSASRCIDFVNRFEYKQSNNKKI